MRAVLNTVSAQACAASGYEAVTLAYHELVGEVEGLGIPAEALETLRLSHLAGGSGVASPVSAEFRDLMREHDVVHFHGLWEPMTARAARVASSVGTPYVVTLHGMLGRWPLSQKALKKRVYLAARGRGFLRGAGCLIYCCEEERLQAETTLTHPRVAVVPLIVELGSSPPSGPRGDGGGFRVGFLGRLHPVKGLDVLIAAVELLLGSGRDVTLHIAGTGEPEHERSIREAASPLLEAGRCEFVGFVGGEEKGAFLRSCDVVVLTSSHENFGLSWAEALHEGVPVVVSRGVGPWREIVEAGGYVTDREAGALAGTLDEISRARAEASARGLRGKAWVDREFSPEVVAGRLHAVYESVAGGGGR